MAIHRSGSAPMPHEEQPMNSTMGTQIANGDGFGVGWTEGRSRTLDHSADIVALRHQHPDNPARHILSDDTRILGSEPLGGLRGAWLEVPESTCVVLRGGTKQILPLSPVAPRAAA